MSLLLLVAIVSQPATPVIILNPENSSRSSQRRDQLLDSIMNSPPPQPIRMPPKEPSTPLAIPLSIVAAGVIVGAAIIFSNRGRNDRRLRRLDAVQEVAPAKPQESS